jgi:hypothetical protein
LKILPDQVFILSAKYSLVGLDDENEPYNLTLNTMSSRESCSPLCPSDISPKIKERFWRRT